METERFAAVILAAGGGTRFAGSAPKLLAELAGRPLVSWAVGAALLSGAAPGDVAVVTGGTELSGVIGEGVVLLDNPRWAQGQATSLAVAVAWAGANGHRRIVVAAGDEPSLLPSAWGAVAGCPGPIAVATYRGRRGHPVALDADIWALLPTAGDQGARILMAAQPELVHEVACDGDPRDVDTVEDLRAADPNNGQRPDQASTRAEA